MVKKTNDLSYIIDKKILKRFSQRENVFGRKLYDKKSDFYKKGMYDNAAKIISSGKKGYSHLDFARIMGSWTVYDYFHGAFSWDKLTDANSVMEKPALDKFVVKDFKKMSKEIKRTAKYFGAFQVGITLVNDKWIYSKDMDNNIVKIPKGCKYAIVMIVKMDGSMIKTSPAYPACIATGLAYSHMAFLVSCMAEFIRNLGYKAIPMGNDTALSIPLAIDAGLGELGRNGLLITPEYGPCVRICKVFTDLPLKIDEPLNFGVTNFCKKCKKCADACEANAIQTVKEPSFQTMCPSNRQGVLRWAVNQDKCYNFWIENGGECSNCIAVCPFFTDKI
jgi:ferredoxin